MTAVTAEPEMIEVALDCVTGEVTVRPADVPLFTSWSPEVIETIRRGGSMWCSIDHRGVIEMRVKPETIWYRLTGELDDFGGEVAVRCDADGVVWRAQPQ